MHFAHQALINLRGCGFNLPASLQRTIEDCSGIIRITRRRPPVSRAAD